MGALRTLMNPMLRKVERVHAMPRSSIRRKIGEAHRDERGLFNHMWSDKTRSKGLRSFEARMDAEDAYNDNKAPLYEHQYHPTKGWRVNRHA